MDIFTERDYWRTLILYGNQVATYKIALGKVILNTAMQQQDVITKEELAVKFLNEYIQRLENGLPQLNLPHRQTVMEKAVGLLKVKPEQYDQVIQFVKDNAFNDVIPRFHTFNKEHVGMDFYKFENEKMIITDNTFRLLEKSSDITLLDELDSRWSLLEASFQIKRENAMLTNDALDIRLEYLSKGYPRKDITNTIPVLNGYQNGVCFYCGETLDSSKIHVDHVLPRSVLEHDEIWNLVLAHEFCNEQKSDLLPPKIYIDKLIERNEYFIQSRHPITTELINHLGNTFDKRKKFILKAYEDCKIVKGYKYTWDGIRGYNPGTDEFYKTLIRNHSKILK